MRLATYRHGNVQKIGALRGETLVDLTAIAPDMISLIEAGPVALNEARTLLDSGAAGVPLAEVQLLAPIPRPRKNIVCLGMNYAAHAYESMRAKGLPETLPPHPVFFTKAVTAVTHPDSPVPLDPGFTEQLDWEVELAFVIGTGGKKISQADSMRHIFGYTILNDISARDVQNRHQQFYRGKSFDGSAPLGPWIVTADELGDPHNLGLRLRVNGETMQDSNTSDLIFKIPEIIAVYSYGTTLEAGDIFATGTPSGVAMGMTPPRWLKPGDVMEAEIDGIGVLRNSVERVG
jgi:2-keto-4-pentenoate hydratase/2-oxohepta-3-ene-1,7-dioic acid hydratase in catechol pathway